MSDFVSESFQNLYLGILRGLALRLRSCDSSFQSFELSFNLGVLSCCISRACETRCQSCHLLLEIGQFLCCKLLFERCCFLSISFGGLRLSKVHLCLLQAEDLGEGTVVVILLVKG